MHPVLAALEREGKISADDLEFLTIHGRDYQGRPLPYGIERRPPGTCLDTADDLAAAGEGRFVQGFALRPGGRLALPHAWVRQATRLSDGGCIDSPAFWVSPCLSR